MSDTEGTTPAEQPAAPSTEEQPTEPESQPEPQAPEQAEEAPQEGGGGEPAPAEQEKQEEAPAEGGEQPEQQEAAEQPAAEGEGGEGEGEGEKKEEEGEGEGEKKEEEGEGKAEEEEAEQEKEEVVCIHSTVELPHARFYIILHACMHLAKNMLYVCSMLGCGQFLIKALCYFSAVYVQLTEEQLRYTKRGIFCSACLSIKKKVVINYFGWCLEQKLASQHAFGRDPA